MCLLGRTVVFAVIGTLTLAPAAGFGQAVPARPPAGKDAPDVEANPVLPEGRALPPGLPVPPGVLPGTDSGPGMRGRNCEHERAPAIGA